MKCYAKVNEQTSKVQKVGICLKTYEKKDKILVYIAVLKSLKSAKKDDRMTDRYI